MLLPGLRFPQLKCAIDETVIGPRQMPAAPMPAVPSPPPATQPAVSGIPTSSRTAKPSPPAPGAAKAFQPVAGKAAAPVPVDPPSQSRGLFQPEALLAAATMGPLLFHAGSLATDWAADKLAPQRPLRPKIAFSILPGPPGMPAADKLRGIGRGALDEFGRQLEAMEMQPIVLPTAMQQRELSPTMQPTFQARV